MSIHSIFWALLNRNVFFPLLSSSHFLCRLLLNEYQRKHEIQLSLTRFLLFVWSRQSSVFIKAVRQTTTSHIPPNMNKNREKDKTERHKSCSFLSHIEVMGQKNTSILCSLVSPLFSEDWHCSLSPFLWWPIVRSEVVVHFLQYHSRTFYSHEERDLLCMWMDVLLGKVTETK